MTDFWLDSPEFDINTDLNGILNFSTILVVIITGIGVYKQFSNALNIGMLAIVI